MRIPKFVKALLLKAAVDIAKKQLSKRSGNGSGSNSSGGGSGQQTQQGKWRDVTDSGDSEGSRGQFGPGATREASRAEIRAASFNYAPQLDGDPDPGEVVWTWVPYAEGDGRGKDRPVLILGRVDEDAVLGCYLSTTSHDGYVAIGTGEWDSRGRTSYLNPFRILRVSDAGMRREGSVATRKQYDIALAATNLAR